MRPLNRSMVIQTWFGAVALMVVAAVASGVTVSFSTAAFLAALCLAPPAILMVLWPGAQPPTARDVLSGRDRRG